MDTQLEARNVMLADKSDLAGIAAMGPDFWREGGLHGSFSPDVFVRTWSRLMDLGLGHAIVMKSGRDTVGALGFMIAPDPNDGELIAQEAFWFVRSDARGAGIRLLVKYEELARAMGVKRASMAHINGLMDDKLDRLFKRRGYHPTETHYWRTL